MLGAIVGDIVGSRYEDHPIKTTEFPLWESNCRITDDTVMTIACADALMESMGKGPKEVRAEVVCKMQYWGNKYPNVGYGYRFETWLKETSPRPYQSWGNGSSMRVSAAGWLYSTIQKTTVHARYIVEFYRLSVVFVFGKRFVFGELSHF